MKNKAESGQLTSFELKIKSANQDLHVYSKDLRGYKILKKKLSTT